MNKKIVAIVLLILCFLLMILFLLTLQKNKNASSIQPFFPTPSPVSVQKQAAYYQSASLSPLEKTEIGITTADQVATVSSSQTTIGNQTTYEIPGVNPIEPDVVITQNGKVIYEKTSFFTQDAGGFPKAQSILATLGTPDEIIPLNRYSESASTYIFAAKGIVLIINPEVNLIYEIERFLPMSLTQYKATYGSILQKATNGFTIN